MTLTACIITNERSTYKYARKLLKRQTYEYDDFIAIGNCNWLLANKRLLERVKTTHFIRVDDDMFLHPRAVEFMVDTMPGKSIMHRGKLYEHYSKMVAGRVKIYNTDKVKSIGGFRANKLGKIDRCLRGCKVK